MGNDLIDCLRSKGNHRLSRYDAFVWMIEHIQHGTIITNDFGVVVERIPFSSSYKRLSEEWNWDRHVVQEFIEELVSLSVISAEREGNTFIFRIGSNSVNRLILCFFSSLTLIPSTICYAPFLLQASLLASF